MFRFVVYEPSALESPMNTCQKHKPLGIMLEFTFLSSPPNFCTERIENYWFISQEIIMMSSSPLQWDQKSFIAK